ncbi:MAG: DNA polymerase III subunit gamma/tau [Limnochordia bacterium]
MQKLVSRLYTGWQQMAYLSLYRKWRPQVFSQVVGQEHIVRTLTNALNTGRVAHAYLFSGPRGTGKTTFARLLAKGLNCEHGPTATPCDECDNCKQITRGSAVDVLEIDGASNRGIDEIRELRDRVRYAPASGRYKVYIIDEVHMLTNEAFNALLKVLEEPPSHIVFVFATTEAHKVPGTILSRCQKFDFRRFSHGQLTGHLKHVAEAEKVEAETQALALIARHAEGSMRDALAIMDQCLSAQPGTLDVDTVTEVLGIVRREALIELVGYILQGDLSGAIHLINALLDQGVEIKQLARDLTAYARDLVLLKAAPTVPLVIADESERETMKEQVAHCSLNQLLNVVNALVAVEAELRWSTSPAMAMEIAMAKAVAGSKTQTADGGSNSEAEVKRLEQRLADLEQYVRRLTPELRSVQAERAPVDAPPPPPAGREGTTEQQSVTADDELVQLRAKWSNVLALLKEERMISTEAFLREGMPVAVEGNQVVICFAARHRFHQTNVEDARHKGAIEKAISRILGRSVRIATVIGDPSEIAADPQPEQNPSTERNQSTGEEQSAQEADIMRFPSVAKAVKYLDGQVRLVDTNRASEDDPVLPGG